MKIEIVYLVQVREFALLGVPVYKIGRTYRSILDRANEYPKGSQFLTHCLIPSAHNVENLLITKFKAKFKHRKDLGREYFEGNVIDMLNEFIELVHGILSSTDRNLENIRPNTNNNDSKNSENSELDLANNLDSSADQNITLNMDLEKGNILHIGPNRFPIDDLLNNFLKREYEITNDTNDICKIKDMNIKFEETEEFAHIRELSRGDKFFRYKLRLPLSLLPISKSHYQRKNFPNEVHGVLVGWRKKI